MSWEIIKNSALFLRAREATWKKRAYCGGPDRTWCQCELGLKNRSKKVKIQETFEVKSKDLKWDGWEMNREIEWGIWSYLGSGFGHSVVPCPESVSCLQGVLWGHTEFKMSK